MKILKDIIFRDDEHEGMFNQFCFQMKKLDCYHYAVAYLLSLDVVVRDHVPDVFDLGKDVIVLEGLNRPWQTDTSRKTTRLLFNLWNGCVSDGEMYTNDEGYRVPLPSRYYAPDEIFSCSYAPYYFEAVRLRFPFPCYFGG